MIREATVTDSKEICEIYNYYVENTVITFEEKAVTASEMRKRIIEVTQSLPWFVYEKDNEVLGYSYASQWKSRSAFRFSVEITIYLKPEHHGLGIGSLLYKKILADLECKDVHIIVGGLALPNKNSEKLHEKFGFKKVAHFHEVGFKFNRWIDVGYWELVLPDKQSLKK